MFRLVNETEEDVVNLFPDERSETQEFAIDAMKTSLEKVALAWVLAIEQLQQLGRGQNEDHVGRGVKGEKKEERERKGRNGKDGLSIGISYW